MAISTNKVALPLFCLVWLTVNTLAFTPALTRRCSSLVFTRGNNVQLSASAAASSKVERKPESAVELTIKAPGSATKAAFDKAVTECSKQITIPGFRKGAKIPPAVLENTLASKGLSRNSLKTDAISSLLNELIEPALKEEHGLEPIGQPKLMTPIEELAESFTPGEDIELLVKCDVWPDIEWKSVDGQDKPYLGLSGSYKRKPFNQQRFDIAMKDLKDRFATLQPMEDGGILAMGDACRVNMEGFMANDDGTKGEPLPNAASGENVEVILGEGRYMEGLVEGLLGGKVGDTRLVTTSFPEKLKDKTLAGKKAVFDVKILEASHRTLPEMTDEFANQVRAGLTADSLVEELKKAIDEEDNKEFIGPRNAALADSLNERLNVDVPDTLVTNQAREKFTIMMTEMRDGGVDDATIKEQINPENFLKYKDLVKDDIVKDFRVSMAIDEIARLEGFEVPPDQIEEQIEAIKKDAEQQGDAENMDEKMIRNKVETTLMRQIVMDYLAENADLEVIYQEEKEEEFDEALMEKLAQESLEREQAMTATQTPEAVIDTTAAETAVEEAKVETKSDVKDSTDKGDQAFEILQDLGVLEEDSE